MKSYKWMFKKSSKMGGSCDKDFICSFVSLQCGTEGGSQKVSLSASETKQQVN